MNHPGRSLPPAHAQRTRRARSRAARLAPAAGRHGRDEGVRAWASPGGRRREPAERSEHSPPDRPARCGHRPFQRPRAPRRPWRSTAPRKGQHDARAPRIPVPARRDLDRTGGQRRGLLRGGRTDRPVPVRRPGEPGGVASGSPCPRRRGACGTATSPTCVPASSTAAACQGPTSPTEGPRCNPHKLALRPLRQGGRPRRAPRRLAVRLPPRADDEDLTFDVADSARQRPARGGDRPGVHRGATTAPPRAPWPTRSSTNCTSRASPSGTRASRSRCAAPTPASPPQPPSSTCWTSASPPWSCCRCTTGSASGSWSSRGSPTTGATTPSASSPRTRGWQPRPIRDGVVREFKTMVRDPARRRASRCSSTSSTTTPPRAASSARRSSSAGWTTPPTTTWPTTGTPPMTSPAPATRSTSAIRGRCS